ncbi:MAG TPA: 50S ribosomal protein L2 [Candidatus Nanoarchaeia archaeon]|nr:50S ribosomal protein L2P [uncultured archaeon]AJS12815.1 50S ribosomal protein L2P [uncultured archaeon]HLC99135.1 50S ribosomal protein L2 [Candidatus Nanoarchaeia archaeon]
MGKNLIQQARGKGSPTYRAPSFRYRGRAEHSSLTDKTVNGEVCDIIHCPGHSGPLVQVKYSNGEDVLSFAAEGIKVGDVVASGPEAGVEIGNTLPLRNVPLGTLVYNIESMPGDGGKFVRSSGTFARVLTKTKDSIVIELPSKKQRSFSPECRACVGMVAGGGRLDKPLLKAGVDYYKMKAKNKLWPSISGSAQNAVDHPFGNSRSSRKSKARPVPRNAPPGRKVGMLRPRRTGRK